MPIPSRPCDECGETFQPKPKAWNRPPQRYCSLSCASKANNRTRWEDKPKSNGAGRVAARRRRRLRHQGTWDGIADQEILERDRWMCWICKRRIGKTFKYPHPKSASVDHLIPLSLGGDDTAFNKKAAHLGCNMARGTGKDEHSMLNFSLDPNAEIIPRRQRKLCVTCGEPLIRGRCKLHMQVRYFTCQKCQRLFVSGHHGRVYCSAECSRSVKSARELARHDEQLQHRSAHQRGLEAKALHEAGMDWREVADKLGYSGGQYAAAAAARAVGKRSPRRTAPYARTPRVGQHLTA